MIYSNDGFNIFGKVQLGYFIVESKKFTQWIDFCKNCLGMHLSEQTDEALSFRVDNYEKRFIVKKGDAEDLSHIGVQLESSDVLNEVLRRFKERDIEYHKGSSIEASFRGVKEFYYVRGPKDVQIEIFIEAIKSTQPLNLLTSGFYTAASGIGHAAITSKKPEKMIRFWQEFFDARLSDTIEQTINGVTLDVTFLRLNERHHSIAIAGTRGLRINPIRTKVQHINFEVLQLDDVVRAYQTCKAHGFTINWEMGQHTNDREISFYVIGPSGFEVELGWNPIRIDEATWQPVKHTGFSLWGHRPQPATQIHGLIHELDNVKNSLLSLKQDEYSPIK